MAKLNIKARAERNRKINKSISDLENELKKLEAIKDEYMQKALAAKESGETAVYRLARSGLNLTLTHIKRIKEMLLNIRITAELHKMGETNADFLSGMSVIAKSISKVNKQSDFVKLQKEIQKALSGMQEAQAGLDSFLSSTDARFDAIGKAPGALSDARIDELISGSVSERELLADAQFAAMTAENGGSAGGGRRAERSAATDGFASPFPPPDGAFRFGGVKQPESGIDRAAVAEACGMLPSFEDMTAPTFALGRTDSGEPVSVRLFETPDMRVTGCGDIALGFIAAAVLFASPDRLRIMAVDLDGSGLDVFNGVPHLTSDVITDAVGAAAAIKELEAEMGNRAAMGAVSPYIALVLTGADRLAADVYGRVRGSAELGIFTLVSGGGQGADRATIAALAADGADVCALTRGEKTVSVKLSGMSRTGAARIAALLSGRSV